MPTLKPIIPALIQQSPINSRSHLSSSLLVCWMFLCFYDFYFTLMPTALLICMENTFWNISRGNFVELFKKSFEFYVESGMRKQTEADIDILRNEQGGSTVTENFKARFYAIVIEHFLRKFHLFSFVALDTFNNACLIQPTLRIEKMKRTGNERLGTWMEKKFPWFQSFDAKNP